MIVLMLSLLGCHLFESLSIDCTAGMPCVTGVGGDTQVDDTDTGGDTGETGDTGDDTAPLVVASSGSVLTVSSTRGDRAYKYLADGSLDAFWEFDGTVGPVDFDGVTDAGVVFGGGTLWWLAVDQDPVALPIDAEVHDVAVADGFAWLATESDVLAVSTAGETHAAFDGGSTGRVGAITAAPEGGIWFTMIVDGVPYLFGWDGSTAPSALLGGEPFDTTGARARVLFVGQYGEPFTCSSAGGIYKVDDLLSGDGTPTVYYDHDLTDVTECGWDEGDQTWLLFSASRGSVRLDQQGREMRVLSAADGYSLVNGNFF